MADMRFRLDLTKLLHPVQATVSLLIAFFNDIQIASIEVKIITTQ